MIKNEKTERNFISIDKEGLRGAMRYFKSQVVRSDWSSRAGEYQSPKV